VASPGETARMANEDHLAPLAPKVPAAFVVPSVPRASEACPASVDCAASVESAVPVANRGLSGVLLGPVARAASEASAVGAVVQAELSVAHAATAVAGASVGVADAGGRSGAEATVARWARRARSSIGLVECHRDRVVVGVRLGAVSVGREGDLDRLGHLDPPLPALL